MKVISINDQRFIVPADMTTKDVQALAGLLVSLVPVKQEYDYDLGEYMYFPDSNGTEVRLETAVVKTKEEAKKHGKESYARYEARLEAKAKTA